LDCERASEMVDLTRVLCDDVLRKGVRPTGDDWLIARLACRGLRRCVDDSEPRWKKATIAVRSADMSPLPGCSRNTTEPLVSPVSRDDAQDDGDVQRAMRQSLAEYRDRHGTWWCLDEACTYECDPFETEWDLECHARAAHSSEAPLTSDVARIRQDDRAPSPRAGNQTIQVSSTHQTDDDDAEWMGLCDAELLNEALRVSREQMTELERFRAEHAHDEKRALAEAMRLSRDLAPLESLNIVPDDDGRADFVAELMVDLERNPAACEFGDRRLAGKSLAEIRHDLTSYQRLDENRRLAACAARDELEARLLRNVTTAAHQEAALRAVVRHKPVPDPEPAPDKAPELVSKPDVLRAPSPPQAPPPPKAASRAAQSSASAAAAAAGAGRPRGRAAVPQLYVFGAPDDGAWARSADRRPQESRRGSDRAVATIK